MPATCDSTDTVEYASPVPISRNSTAIAFVSAFAAITGMTGASGRAATCWAHPPPASASKHQRTTPGFAKRSATFSRLSHSRSSVSAFLYSILRKLKVKSAPPYFYGTLDDAPPLQILLLLFNFCFFFAEVCLFEKQCNVPLMLFCSPRFSGLFSAARFW